MTGGFTQDWYPPRDAAALTRFALKAMGVQGDLLELGSYEGRSALILRRALPSRPLLCVDRWDDPNVYHRFRRNVEGHRIGWLRATWEEFKAEPVSPRPIALIHIDMDHTYDHVRDQIAWAQDVIEPGGMLVGHDYNPIAWPEVVRAVDTHLVGREYEAAVWAWQAPR